ncbi:MAG: hypothetical protein AAGB12_15810 [Pseudomonadota bacterium]
MWKLFGRYTIKSKVGGEQHAFDVHNSGALSVDVNELVSSQAAQKQIEAAKELEKYLRNQKT